MSKEVFGLITLFFIGSLVVLAVTHAAGFSKSAGTLFDGINTLGTTLTGAKIKAGE
jgi:hypothetical protein